MTVIVGGGAVAVVVDVAVVVVAAVDHDMQKGGCHRLNSSRICIKSP